MTVLYLQKITQYLGFPGGSLLKNLPVTQEMQEMPVWSLGQEDPLEEGMVTHFKAIYSCLENPKDRGAWQATVHRVTKSWAWLKRLSTQNPVSMKALRVLKSSYYFKIFTVSYEESMKVSTALCLLSIVLKKFKWDSCKYELQVNEVNVSKGFRHVEWGCCSYYF